MDSSFVKIILHSCEDAVKEIENTEDYEKLDSTKVFVPTSETAFDALATSLTNLLCHKVSKEVYQRYSVRLSVIVRLTCKLSTLLWHQLHTLTNLQNVLRNWCCIPEKFRPLHVLRSSENMLDFVKNIVRNCVTDDALNNCVDSDELVPLTSSLICLLPKNPDFISDVDRLITKIARLETTVQSERLLRHVASKRNDIPVNSSTVELIYTTQARKLIEEPLLNNFAESVGPSEGNVPSNCNVNELIELCTEFPPVFHVLSCLLKELFVKLNYARFVSDYTTAILDRIRTTCERQGKHMIDLYPRNLHSCLILMRIEPCHHSVQSKEYTLRALKDVSTQSAEDSLILLSHFPVWLKEYATYVGNVPDNV